MPELQIVRVRHRSPTRWHRFADAVRSFTIGPFSLKDPRLREHFGGGPTAAGVSVTEATALNYSAVWQAVTLIAGDVGSLPLIFYKRDKDGGKSRYPDHPLYSILHDAPNSEMSSMVFRETLQAHLLTWGNAYAEIERDSVGRPAALWPLLPSQVQPFRDESKRLRYRVSGGTQDIIFAPSDMLHLPGLGFDGVMGYSPIRQARESLGLLAAAEKFGATFFGNGSTFGGLLKHPKILGDQAQATLRNSIDALHKGSDKAHRFLILEEGMDYAKLGVNPNDAQFLETRRFQIAEVARWFNLPMHKLREMENSSVRANIEQEALDYYVSTLRPWLTRWEQEINRKLISPRERFIQFSEFLLEGVLRGDMKSRYDAYAIGRNWGWLSVNEIRSLENMNPIADGDKYLSPMNMIPANRLDEVIDKQVAPAPAPVAPVAAEPAALATNDDRAVLVARIEAQATTIGTLQTRNDSLGNDLAAVTAESERLSAALVAAIDERDGLQARCGVAESASVAHAEARKAADTERAAATESLLQAQAREQTALKERNDALGLAVDTEAKSALALAAAVAETAAIKADRDAIEVGRATLEAARDAARAETADAVNRAHAAAAAQTAADAAVLVSAQEATEARAEARSAREASDRAVAETAALRSKQADTFTALATAQRAVVTETLQRLIRREIEKARSKRATAEKLRAWAETFYEDHEADLWVDALQSPVAVHQILVGSDRSAREVAQTIVMSHFARSRQQIGSVVASDPAEYHAALDRCLTRWESERAGHVADAFVREEIAYVRSIQ